MENSFSKILWLFAGLSLSLVVGCQCPGYRQAGFPRILLQPEDMTVMEGGRAVFSAKAAGAGLTYQWFRNDLPLSYETNAQIVVSGVKGDDGKLGFYHCRIESGVATGDPRRTETRKAALGLSAIRLVSMNGTNMMLMSEQQPLPPGDGPYNGPACVGKYCTYWAFSERHLATNTTLAASLEKKNANGDFELQPVLRYELLWKYSRPATSGCATNYTDSEKRALSVLKKKYRFNVYIKPDYCESKITYYRLNIYFP